MLKPLCSEMIHRLKFCFECIVGLLYSLALRYCQNKAWLRYIFGSVYFSHMLLTKFTFDCTLLKCLAKYG